MLQRIDLHSLRTHCRCCCSCDQSPTFFCVAVVNWSCDFRGLIVGQECTDSAPGCRKELRSFLCKGIVNVDQQHGVKSLFPDLDRGVTAQKYKSVQCKCGKFTTLQGSNTMPKTAATYADSVRETNASTKLIFSGLPLGNDFERGNHLAQYLTSTVSNIFCMFDPPPW